MKSWKTIKLKECIIQLNTGLNPRKNFSLGEGNIKYITAKNLTKEGFIDFSNCAYVDSKAKEIIHKRSDIRKGDILFSSRAPVGHCHLINYEPDFYDIGESIFSIRVNENIVLPEYLCLYLSSDLFINTASNKVSGSVIQEIRISDLLDTDILIPDKTVQSSIAKFIGNIDKKIELNKAIQNDLEGMAKLLFDYWFIQFDFPNNNKKPYKTYGGKMVWNNELKKDIPEKWQVGTLHNLCNVVWGQCPEGKYILNKDTLEDNILDYCSGAGDMRNGFVVDCQAKTFVNTSRRMAHCNAVLLSVAGSIGAICVTDHDISLGRAAVAFESKDITNNMFIINVLKMLSNQVQNLASGSIQKVINTDHIESMKFAYDIDALKEYGTVTNEIYKQIVAVSLENKCLMDMRDFLLPMLITEQISINYE